MIPGKPMAGLRGAEISAWLARPIASEPSTPRSAATNLGGFFYP